jgi:hypothetical protein
VHAWQGSARGELRDDVPAELLALAIVGLTDLALVEQWASDDSTPSLEEFRSEAWSARSTPSASIHPPRSGSQYATRSVGSPRAPASVPCSPCADDRSETRD